MKRILILALIIGCQQSLQAQTEQGQLLIGANSNLNFSNQNQDGFDDNITNISVNATGGYFVIDNLAAGINLGFSRASQGNLAFSNFVFGPFARYYIQSVFVGASFSALSARGDGIDTSNGSQIDFELGYAAFLNNFVAIEPTISYLTTGGDFDGLTSIALNIGFTIYIPSN